MANLTFSAGRPDHDWESILHDVLENGIFNDVGNPPDTTITIVSGNFQIVLTGTALEATADRTITGGGAVTGFTIIDDGDTVLTMSGLTDATSDEFQTALSGAGAVDFQSEAFKVLFAPFFTDEQVSATGSADGDLIFGSALADTINAGGGDDYVRGGAGFDILNGGGNSGGNDGAGDFLDYGFDERLTGVDVDLGANTVFDHGTNVAVDSISGFESVGGTQFDDVLTGDGGHNVLVGGDGDDMLNGLGGDDALIGEDGNDTLNGGTGSNFYRGGAGTDTYVGGTGTGDGEFDKVSFDDETGGSGIAATFNGGGDVSFVDTYGNAETGSGIEAVKGSQYADQFNGSADDDQVEGLAGNDVFDMGGGFDSVDYQFEPDAGGTHGVIVNLSGSSILVNQLGFSNVTVAAGHAYDSFGDDDTLISVEWVQGTNFSDYLQGGDANEELRGNGGDDIIFGGAGDDNIRGDEGGNDAGNDTLNGEAGNDSFKGGAGADIIDGGADFDTINYNLETTFTGDNATHGVIVNLSNAALVDVSVTGITTTTVAAQTAVDTRNYIDMLTSIERVEGTGYQDYIVIGGAGHHELIGNGGGDTLIGGDDDDFFTAGQGNDTIDGGGGGEDLLSYAGENGSSGITAVFHGGGSVTITDTYGTTDTVANMEEIDGSFRADTFTGSTDGERVTGMAGNDIFNLGGGIDTVDYQDEQDGGSNGVVVNLSAAAITSSGAAGVHTVQANHALDMFGDTDTFSGVENISGSNMGDYIVGNAEANRLEGRGGDDTIRGGGGDDEVRGDDGDDGLFGEDGNDLLKGGAGNDTLNGGNGIDFINYNLETTFTGDSATHGVIVNMSDIDLVGVTVSGIPTTTVASGTAIDTRNFIDTLISIENIEGTGFDDIIAGNAADNVINGGDGDDQLHGGEGGNDRLEGGDGNDQLAGGFGRDFLVGGTGADQFGLFAANEAQHGVVDWIDDFNDGQGDQINLGVLLAAPYNGGAGEAVNSLVRAIDTGHGVELQVDADGTANGAAWRTLFHLDGVNAGDTVNVILDLTLLAGTDITATAGEVGADLNGDGRSDILLQNRVSGAAGIWTMDGATITEGNLLSVNPGPTWHQKLLADFNGDGNADILWQNDSGQGAIWTMNGTQLVSGNALSVNPGPTWHIKDAADFDGDGKADILWQNDSGQGSIWTMDGTQLVEGNALSVNPGPTWHMIAAADFNADGKADILWQNDSGQGSIWTMNGTQLVEGNALSVNPGPAWHMIDTADFNGDDKSDILWQNNDGTVAVWLMDGTNLMFGAAVGNPGTSWHALASEDYNGDNIADILFQNTNGQGAIWTMDGTTILSGQALPNLGSDWVIA